MTAPKETVIKAQRNQGLGELKGNGGEISNILCADFFKVNNKKKCNKYRMDIEKLPDNIKVNCYY